MNEKREPQSRAAAGRIVGNATVAFFALVLVPPFVAVELFGPRLSFEAGQSPAAVVVADFNADGALDLAVANGDSQGNWGSTVNILLGDGRGSFSRPAAFELGSFTPVAIAHGDFDLDGYIDLVTANSRNHDLAILLGDGQGDFRVVLKPLGERPSYVAVGQFDADGQPDLAVALEDQDSVGILFGNGQGEFLERRTARIAVGHRPGALVVADFDSDGATDLAVVNQLDGTVSIVPADGFGGFLPRTDLTLEDVPRAIAAADFDGDGTTDLAVVTLGDPSGVHILPGNGEGLFGPSTKHLLDGNPIPAGIVAADLNDDGMQDLVIPELAGSVYVLRGDGDLAFAQTRLQLGGYPAAVAVADFAVDGAVDLAVLHERVQVLPGDGLGGFPDGVTKLEVPFERGTLGSITAADFNADHHADLAVASGYDNRVTILVWDEHVGYVQTQEIEVAGPTCLLPADFDADGFTDLAVVQRSAGSVGIFFGDGNGRFGGDVEFPVGDRASLGVVDDFDLDGFLDLAVVPKGLGDWLRVLWGDDQGGFQSESIHPCRYRFCNPRALVVADFDRDGRPDLAVANDWPETISILRGVEGRRFDRAEEISIRDGNYSLASSYFNDDANPDLAVASGRQVHVLLGDGKGGFFSRVSTASPRGTDGILAADFNDDGLADLGVTSDLSLTVLLGDESGSFFRTPGVAVGPAPFATAVSDFDGDGLVDLAVASHDDAVRILTNRLADRADVNGSNRIDGFDTAEVARLSRLRRDDPGYERTVDVDLNGIVDGYDLCRVAARFGELRQEASPLHATVDDLRPADPDTVTFQPVSSEGDLLTVQVLVNDDDDDVAGAAFAVTFAPEAGADPVLEYVNFTPGTSLSGAAGQAYNLDPDTPGRVDVNASRIPIADRPGSGLDPVLNLIFRVIGAGSVRLGFAAVEGFPEPSLVDANDEVAQGVEFRGGVRVSADASPGGPPGQRIAVFPERLDFGDVAIGMTARRKVRVFNRGYSVLEVSDVGTHPAFPEFRSFFTSAYAIPPYGFVDQVVEFSPTRAGQFSTELVITNDDRDVAVPLTGTSEGAPANAIGASRRP